MECNCKHRECKGYKEWVVDPYQEDIYGIIEYRWLCGGEQYELCMDI